MAALNHWCIVKGIKSNKWLGAWGVGGGVAGLGSGCHNNKLVCQSEVRNKDMVPLMHTHHKVRGN